MASFVACLASGRSAANRFGRVRRVDQAYYPFLQAIALEFHVTDRLDGTTLSSPFVLPPDPAAITDPDSGAVLVGDAFASISGRRVRVVDRLGLIDLTGGIQRGAIADRIVRSILIVGPSPVAAGVDAFVGRAYDGTADLEGQVPIPVGSNGIDSDNCIFVPQTAMLQLDGLVATPGNPILVRVDVWQPHTAEELALMTDVCCCRANVIDDEGEPFYTTALYVGAACLRTVTGAAPPSAARGVGFTVVTVTGTGFQDGDVVVFMHEDGLGILPIDQINVLNSTTMLVRVDVNGAVPQGAYNIFVSPPLAPPQCGGVGEGLFTVT